MGAAGQGRLLNLIIACPQKGEAQVDGQKKGGSECHPHK